MIKLNEKNKMVRQLMGDIKAEKDVRNMYELSLTNVKNKVMDKLSEMLNEALTKLDVDISLFRESERFVLKPKTILPYVGYDPAVAVGYDFDESKVHFSFMNIPDVNTMIGAFEYEKLEHTTTFMSELVTIKKFVHEYDLEEFSFPEYKGNFCLSDAIKDFFVDYVKLMLCENVTGIVRNSIEIEKIYKFMFANIFDDRQQIPSISAIKNTVLFFDDYDEFKIMGLVYNDNFSTYSSESSVFIELGNGMQTHIESFEMWEFIVLFLMRTQNLDKLLEKYY